MKSLKYLIIPYIALGLVLSMPIGVTYYCDGAEMFPEYFGSPFVFKQKSLGSSMTYFYSISGVVMNLVIWSIPLIGVRFLALNFIKKSGDKVTSKTLYKWLVKFMIVFSTINISLDFMMMGNGFQEDTNYWYFDMEKKAQDWKVECEGKWGVFDR